MHYENLNEFDQKAHFLVPNESTAEWRGLVKDLYINRAAAICSGGEVGMVALLPTVRKELVLIDHSYASLSVAMLKFLLLQEVGPKETRRLLTTTSGGKDLQAKVNALLPKLPKEVVAAFKEVVAHPRYGYNGFTQKSAYSYTAAAEHATVNSQLVREWNNLPQRAVWRCATKLDKVKFLHGDLTDLPEQGLFDLLYLSNAMEHTSRTKTAPSWDTVTSVVRPGGYVIVAHHKRGLSRYSSGYGPPVLSNTETQLERLGFDSLKDTISTGASMHWTQSLFQKRTEPAKAVAA